VASWFNPCAEGDTSFDLTVQFAEVLEGVVSNEDWFPNASGLIYVRSGTWSVNLERIPYAWSGAGHTHPIYARHCFVEINDGTSPGFQTYFVDPIPFWPCDTGADDSFHNEGFTTPTELYDPDDPSGNGLSCGNDFLLNLGCPQCGPVPLRLWGFTFYELALANGVAFDIHAVGTWIG
jgi:hypothetical protein